MKFKITLTPSNYYQDAKKSKYLNPVVVESLEDFKKVILKDYACAVYKDNHRSIDDFLYADAIVFDIDNDHSENPDDWITPDKVSSFFDDVPIYIQYSRNHMKIKNGKPARPKFHIIFPIDKVTDAKEYRTMKEKVYSIFPFVDGQALDSARLLFGTAEPNVDYIDGTRTLTDFLKEYDNEAKFAQLGETIPEGSRNKTMHSIALKLLTRYGLCSESLDKYREASTKCSPPLENDELNTIWKSALKYYKVIKSQKDYIPPEQFTNDSWDKLVPLDEVVLPAFPIDALPEVLRNYVSDVAESTQTPIDMAGVASLALMSIAMQPRYKVIGKADWEEQLSLYCMIVAEPSDRKSAVFNQIIKVIQSFEAEYNEHHSIDVLKSQEEHSSLEKKYKKASKDYENGKITKEEYDEAFRKYSTHKVIKPISLTLDDVTSESLTNEIESQDGCIALVSSEGGIFDIISGSYTNFPNIDIFLKGYSGDFIKVSRIGRPSLYVKNPRLTILLTVQPKVLESVVNNGTFTGRGLSARFLYSVPKSLVGSRKFETKPIDFDNKKRFSDLIHEILKEPKTATIYISLSNEAYSLLKDYYESFELRLATDLKEIGGWAGKLVGNILRISALITRARNVKYDAFLYTPSSDDSAEWIVQKEDMESAIKLGNYFLEHARYAFDFMDDNTTKKQALNFLEKLKASKVNEISFREASRMCKFMNKKENATAVINLLSDYGYLREKRGTSRAHNKGIIYEVNPAIYDKERPP
jgi:hypothetical protein